MTLVFVYPKIRGLGGPRAVLRWIVAGMLLGCSPGTTWSLTETASSARRTEPRAQPPGVDRIGAQTDESTGGVASDLVQRSSAQTLRQEADGDAPRFDDAQIDWGANPVLRTLGNISSSLTWSEYSTGLSVNEKAGVYKFDCSGLVYWVLRKAAPRAARWSAAGLERRPLARDFQRRIARIPLGEAKYGWRRIAKVTELQAGDVVAWIKPEEIRSPNTGHVAFVLLPPRRLEGYSNAYLLRIADSSRLLHDEDTRTDRDGFGFGTILLVTDLVSGEPTAYGWAADKWRAFETAIALGRPEE